MFFKSGICAMATTRHLPRARLCPTDYWANTSTFWTQDIQEKSCTMLILSLSPMLSKQNFPGHLLAPIKTNISLSIFDQTQQHTKNKNWPQHSLQAQLHKLNTTLERQNKFLAIPWDAERFLNFSPTFRDDPFKIGLSYIVRMAKLARAINHDLSVLGIQAFSLLSSLSVQHLCWQPTCLKYKHPGHLPLTPTGSVHRWHHRCNSIKERFMCTSCTVRHLLSSVLKAICLLSTLRVPASGYIFLTDRCLDAY